MLSRLLLRALTSDGSILCRRQMHLQEFHSKRLLRNNGLNVQRFVVVDSAEHCSVSLNELLTKEYVVKAQILAGGPGKGHFDNGFRGGVHITKKREELKYIISNMIGHRLITNQTGPSGLLVENVMVAESVPIIRESYVCIMLDRNCDAPVVIVSPSGGMEIEQAAIEHPESILKIAVDLESGLTQSDAEKLVSFLGFSKAAAAKAAEQLLRLYDVFVKTDAQMIEVNPFCEVEGANVCLIDAKLQFDDNAAFRQKEIFQLHDAHSDDREYEASKHGLNFISLDGNIGCLVNGAGLAMATMDLINFHGGKPANFLDMGGGAAEEQVVSALKILILDNKVKTILINIFGGIVNCEVIAHGLISAFRKLNVTVPVVVRLEGTNVNSATKILRSSGLPIYLSENFEDCVQMAVKAVHGLSV